MRLTAENHDKKEGNRRQECRLSSAASAVAILLYMQGEAEQKLCRAPDRAPEADIHSAKSS
jgi:hypothetical protein